MKKQWIISESGRDKIIKAIKNIQEVRLYILPTSGKEKIEEKDRELLSGILWDVIDSLKKV